MTRSSALYFLGWMLALLVLAFSNMCFDSDSLGSTLGGFALFALGALWACSGRGTWLVLLPPILVLVQPYPLTGSWLVTYADYGVLGLLAGKMSRSDTQWELKPKRLWPWYLMGGLLVLSAIRGWMVLPQPLVGDQLSIYTTSSNLLLQLKPVLFAAIAVPLLTGELGDHVARLNAWKSFQQGVRIAAWGMAASVLFERWISVGLFDFDTELRVTGTCMSMHIGDQHIDAFWALSLPVVFSFEYQRGWSALERALLQMLSLYAILATMSRATIAAAGLVIVGLAIWRWTIARRTFQTVKSGGRKKLAIVIVASSLLLLFLWLGGEAVPKRFANSLEGWRERSQHWNLLLRSAESNVNSGLFGSGLGTYPFISRKVLHRPVQPISLVEIAGAQSDDHKSVRLFCGEGLYLEQLISASAPLPWRIQLRARGSTENAIPSCIVCKKVLLQSFESIQLILGDREGVWSGTVDSKPADALEIPWPRRVACPTVLAIAPVGPGGQSIEVSDVELLDANGRNILVNSEFHGTNPWYFTCDDHLVWRAKNCWLHVFIECGALGLLAFTCLVLAPLLNSLYITLTQTSWTGALLFMSQFGFLVVAFFGTLVDTAWIVMLWTLVLVFSANVPGPMPQTHKG